MTTDVEPEVLATGYQLVEAPRADGAGGVFFTDVLGGGVHRWSRDGVDVVVPKRRGVGGLALHADGGIVVSGRDITHVAADGTNRLLFAAPDGVTGFNDICAATNGTLLCGGLRFRPFAGEEPVPGSFWHVTSESTDEVVVDVHWPNGVGDNGDGVWCFCDYSRGTVTIIDGDNRRVVSTPSGEADGLAFDDADGVWVAQPRAGSLVRLRLDDGGVDRTLDVPGHQPASVAFDGDAMYVTTIATESRPGALLRLPAPVPGRRHLIARI